MELKNRKKTLALSIIWGFVELSKINALSPGDRVRARPYRPSVPNLTNALGAKWEQILAASL